MLNYIKILITHVSFQLISKYNFIDHKKSFLSFLGIILFTMFNFLCFNTWIKTKVLILMIKREK